jgi:hypothetical protein
MDADVKLQLKQTLNVTTASISLVSEIALLSAAILSVTSSLDCVGPTNQKWRAYTTFSPDKYGNYIRADIPANATGCLLDKQCSYRPNVYNNQSLCESNPALSQASGYIPVLSVAFAPSALMGFVRLSRRFRTVMPIMG